jgi:hypothetical protein
MQRAANLKGIVVCSSVTKNSMGLHAGHSPVCEAGLACCSTPVASRQAWSVHATLVVIVWKFTLLAVRLSVDAMLKFELHEVVSQSAVMMPFGSALSLLWQAQDILFFFQ